MPKVNIVIDGKNYIADSRNTILEVAREHGIYIPTLCHYDGLKTGANCRICIVEIENVKGFKTACNTKIEEGMVVNTISDEIVEARKMTLEMILANHSVDCHHCLRTGVSKEESLDAKLCESCFWCDCVRDGFCELQTLAREYHIDVLPYMQQDNLYEEDDSLGSIVLNPNKCIKCRRCIDLCKNVQNVGNLSLAKCGYDMKVVPNGEIMKNSLCIGCGRCVDVCPTGAIYMKEHKDEVIYMAHSYDVDTIVQVSDDIITEMTDLYKVKYGDITMEHICSVLHKLGFDKVVTDKEFEYISCEQAVNTLKENIGNGPVIITSSHSVINFAEKYFSEMKEHIKFYNNAQAVFSKYVESLKNERVIKSINITSNKEMAVQATEKNDVDYVVNARELYRIFIRTGGAPSQRKPMKFDNDFNKEIPYPSLLGKKAFSMQKEIEYFELEIEGSMRKCVVANNLTQVKRLLKGEYKNYDVIRLNA